MQIRAEAKEPDLVLAPENAMSIKWDAINHAQLESEGWKVLVLWEFELKDLASLEAKLRAFLES